MPKDRAPKARSDRRDRQTRGGYPAGGKQVSEFTPPPSGPAPGATPSAERPDRDDPSAR
jgi:hypothetical protein